MQKNEKKRIAAVIVTYNRKELLRECLSAVLGQTRQVDRVFLIDNASTDNTFEYLTEQGLLSTNIIKYIRNEKNTGGAGGFSQGIKIAFEGGYDWLWIMDDDVEPKLDALERAFEYSDTFDCIQMNRVDPTGRDFKWEQAYCPILNTVRFKDTLEYNQIAQVNLFCFEGLLINRKVIDAVGYPPASYFIRWDDLLYGYLCSRVANIALVKNSILKRKLHPLNGYSSKLSVYYELRNRVWTRKIIHAIDKPHVFYKCCSMVAEFLTVCVTSLSYPRLILASWKGYFGGILTVPPEYQIIVSKNKDF